VRDLHVVDAEHHARAFAGSARAGCSSATEACAVPSLLSRKRREQLFHLMLSVHSRKTASLVCLHGHPQVAQRFLEDRFRNGWIVLSTR